MKYKKYFNIMLLIGVIMSSTLFVVADQQKSAKEIEVTVENAGREIKNIKNTVQSELVSESVLSDDRMEAYTDENGDLYFYNDNEEMVQFISNVESTNSKAVKASEEDVKNAADLYLENLVESPFYYQIDCIEYDMYTDSYLVVYVHKVNGLDTNDLVMIGISNNLNLTYFSIPRAYAFEKMEGIEVEEEKLKKEALDKYYQKYGNSVLDVKVEDFQLGTDDNENIGYQIAVDGSMVVEGEKIPISELIFIPYYGDN